MSFVKEATWLGPPAQGRLRNITDVRGVESEIKNECPK